jgi:mannitol/fructose-specific phosphotransferase system IIA component (Ntr-type)
MRLRDILGREQIRLDLAADTKADVLSELVDLLGLDAAVSAAIREAIAAREQVGSTGIGQRIAIPHCRSEAVDRLHVAYGRKLAGIEYDSVDHLPVRHFFLIVSPPGDRGGGYLAALARVAQLCKMGDVIPRLDRLERPEDLLALLEEKA